MAESVKFKWDTGGGEGGTPPIGRQIIAGLGLMGGGDLSQDVTIDVGAGDGIQVNTDSVQIKLASPSGLSLAMGDLQIDDAIAGAGLAISNKVLSVGAGNGITIGADTVGLTTPGTLSVNSTNNPVGSHTHAITSSANPGAAASLLASDASGYLTLVRVKTDTLVDKSGGNLTISPAGDVIIDPTGKDVLPATNYDINLGAITKKYLTLHAAELWVETLVAQNTIATIGGRILVAPTTTLTRDLAAAGTTLYVKHNQMANGDRVYLENNGNVEWIAITSGPTIQLDGDYAYTCTRNLDGSGSNDWYAGDAVLNTGTTGDGYIDIYSLRSIRSASHIGPSVLGNVRTGTTYSNLSECWAIGNLNGIYGYGADTFGAAFGKYANSCAYITIEPTNGVRLVGKSSLGADTVKIHLHMDGDVLIGTDVSAAASTTLAIFSAAQTYNSESVSVGDMLIGDNSTSKANIFWDKSEGRLKFRSGSTAKSYIDTDGSLVVVDPGGGIFDRAAALNWINGSDDIATIGTYSSIGLVGCELATKPVSGKTSTLYLTGESEVSYSGMVIIRGKSGTTTSSIQLWATSGGTRSGIFTGDMFTFGANNDPCNVRYTGKFISWQSTGLEYDTWPLHPLTVPLTSTSWDGDAYSTTAKTKIDLSVIFGAPAGVKSVLVRLACRDSASAANSGLFFCVSPNNTAGSSPIVCRPSGLPNDYWAEKISVCPCDANGDIYYQIAASGAGTMDCYLEIWAYFI